VKSISPFTNATAKNKSGKQLYVPWTFALLHTIPARDDVCLTHIYDKHCLLRNLRNLHYLKRRNIFLILSNFQYVKFWSSPPFHRSPTWAAPKWAALVFPSRTISLSYHAAPVPSRSPHPLLPSRSRRPVHLTRVPRSPSATKSWLSSGRDPPSRQCSSHPIRSAPPS
jgi:hypothetical protein